MFSSQLLHLWDCVLLSSRARTSTNRLRWDEGGKLSKVSVSGIGNEVWQTGHFTAVCSCLRAKYASLSRHSRQNEWRHGNVLGFLTVSMHNGHSASFLRFLKMTRTSMMNSTHGSVKDWRHWNHKTGWSRVGIRPLLQLVTWPLFTNPMILLSTWNYFSRNKKSSWEYATMPIWVRISFKLVFLQLKEIIRICMGKRRFALQSRWFSYKSSKYFPKFSNCF